MPIFLLSKRVTVAFLVGALFLITVPSTVVAGSQEQLLVQYGRKTGLCVVIGCGSPGTAGLAADLARSGDLLVHGFALSEADAQRARATISAAGVDGVATIEHIKLNPLPLRDNLVNLLLIADLAAAKEAGLTLEEARRVTAPFGMLCVRRGAEWEVTPKPLPEAMDEWTHEEHGPDGNPVSSDTVVQFPVGFHWHTGLPMNLNNPKRSGNAWSSTRGMSIMGGRVFTLSDSVLENLGPMYKMEHGLDQYVTARDAFSGLFIWRTRVGSTYYGGLYFPNRAPFAAVGDHVFVASERGSILALDAATGAEARTYDTAYIPGRLLVDDGVVVAATWKDGAQVGGMRLERRRMDYSVADGTVEAFDVATAKRLWKRDELATSIRSSDGILYMLSRAGADTREEMRTSRDVKEEDLPPRPEQSVAAVDLHTGEEIWTVPSSSFATNTANLRIDTAGPGAVVITENNGVKTHVLRAKDGSKLLQRTGYAAFQDGLLHVGGRSFDVATGEEDKPSRLSTGRTICTPQWNVNNITVRNRASAFTVDGKATTYGGTRGACLFGSIPAYGAFYNPQNWCACAPAQIPGFIVFGPITDEPTPGEMETPAPVVPGPAAKVASVSAAGVVSDDWPMYRRDAERCSASPMALPATLETKWISRLTQAPTEGLVAVNWREYLISTLTAPVVSDGIVVAADPNRNQVIALDAVTGAEKWRYVTGGRVDTPPTLYKGLCLFGSHDGYVYAVSTSEGRLVWRMRAAPREERMVSYGKVESPWPVIGTVLVADGVGYASAGRTEGSDGGIVVRAFDPTTGAAAWAKTVPITTGNTRRTRRNDLLLKVGDAIQLMVTRLDATTGKPVEYPMLEYLDYLRAKRSKPDIEPVVFDEVSPTCGYDGFIGWNWTRLGTRKHGKLELGNFGGECISWNETLACSIGNGGTRITAADRDKIASYGEKLASDSTRWGHVLPGGYQGTSVIVCADAVVVGGGVYTGDAGPAGFVRVLSLDKGQELCECRLDAPLAFNGLAAVAGKVYATLENGTAVCLAEPAEQIAAK